MRHALDVSNYSGPITAEQFVNLRDNFDIGAVFVQAISPPPGYPPGVTAQQIQAALDAGGLAVHPYVFWWYGVGTDFLKRQLDLLTPFTGKLHRVWDDVEDTSGGVASALRSVVPIPGRPSEAVTRVRRQPRPLAKRGPRLTVSADSRVQDVAAWLEVSDTFPTKLGGAAIYGASWHWLPYMGNTWVFSQAGRKIWPATYNNLETLTDWDWFGGWSGEAAAHQYAGTSTLAGVGNVDLDVIGDAELADAPVQPPVDWGWLQKKDLVVEAAGELLTICDQLDAEANRKVGPRRAPILDLSKQVRDRGKRILA
jgi:hypothetical protein